MYTVAASGPGPFRIQCPDTFTDHSSRRSRAQPRTVVGWHFDHCFVLGSALTPPLSRPLLFALSSESLTFMLTYPRKSYRYHGTDDQWTCDTLTRHG